MLFSMIFLIIVFYIIVLGLCLCDFVEFNVTGLIPCLHPDNN